MVVFVCKTCLFESPSAYKHQRHLHRKNGCKPQFDIDGITIIPPNKIIIYTCPKCDFHTDLRSTYIDHTNRENPCFNDKLNIIQVYGEHGELKGKQYQCKQCYHTTNSQRDCMRHINRKEPCTNYIKIIEEPKQNAILNLEIESKQENILNSDLKLGDKNVQVKKLIQCEQCTRCFTNKRNLHNHNLVTQNNCYDKNINIINIFNDDGVFTHALFQCKICMRKPCTKISNCRAHIYDSKKPCLKIIQKPLPQAEVIPIPFACDKCDGVFTSKCHYDMHVKSFPNCDAEKIIKPNPKCPHGRCCMSVCIKCTPPCEHNKIKRFCIKCSGEGPHLIRKASNQVKRAFMYDGAIQKTKPSITYLGCETDYFLKYIKSKMALNMSSEITLSDIHLDHIKPVSKFNLSIPEEFLKCAHYTNLQPLLAGDNITKGNKWEDEDEEFWKKNIIYKEYPKLYPHYYNTSTI